MKNQNKNQNRSNGNNKKQNQQYVGKQRTDRPKNKQGHQRSVNNFTPYTTGKGDKQQRREEEVIDTTLRQSTGNPIELYTKYSKFASDAANLPFALPLGARMNLEFTTQLGRRSWAVPGIMRIVWTPAIGISKDFTSPINRSSTRFFTYLRSNQKASAQYDHQDITMMELALDSCYAFHAMCERIYATANAVTPLNEYYTRALLNAQCVSLDDVSKNMQDFRSWINSFAYNLSQFALPKGITLFDRHRWMGENYYVDSPSSRAQTYIFVPRGFWIYDNTVETGSQLTFLDYAAPNVTTYTIAQLMAMGNQMLNAIAGDEDFAYISGDIYNFYGGEVYAVPYIEESLITVPKYDEVVLSQIENATVVGEFTASPIITQNPSVNSGAILFNPTISRDMLISGNAMNFHHDSPTSDQVIEATRLMAVPLEPASGKVVTGIASCGTELVNRLDIWQVNPDTGANRFFSTGGNVLLLYPTQPSLITQIASMTYMAQFDWAPGMWVFLQQTESWGFVGSTWDIDNFNVIPDDQIKYIHEACLWSLFEVGNNRQE